MITSTNRRSFAPTAPGPPDCQVSGVSLMNCDLDYIDLEERAFEALENPFGQDRYLCARAEQKFFWLPSMDSSNASRLGDLKTDRTIPVFSRPQSNLKPDRPDLVVAVYDSHTDAGDAVAELSTPSFYILDGTQYSLNSDETAEGFRELIRKADQRGNRALPAPCKTLGLDMPERTYRHGLRQLLEREFLDESLVDGVYFVYIR